MVANHTPRGPNTEGGTGLFDHNGVPSRRDYRDRRTRLSIAVRLEVKLQLRTELELDGLCSTAHYDQTDEFGARLSHAAQQVCRLLANCTRFYKMLENIRRIFWSVTRSPERIKKMSTPTKPPRNPG